MTTNLHPVHASFGTWEVRRTPDGRIERYVGIFPEEQRDHAFGTVFFLRHRAKVDDPRSVNGHVQVVLDTPAAINVFDKFACGHPEITIHDPAFLFPEISPSHSSEAGKLKPLPPEEAEALVNKYTWETYEVPGNRQQGMLVAIGNPEDAFQIAAFLAEKGLIAQTYKARIQAYAEEALQHGEAASIPIAIEPSVTPRFNRMFPEAGMLPGDKTPPADRGPTVRPGGGWRPRQPR